MRIAEFVMAIVMGVFSIYLMWKSAELPIGWIPDEGPGGGAFPFWLSAGMLLCCIAIIVRGVLRLSPISTSTDTYMDRRTVELFLINAGALAVTIGLFHIVGAYFAIALFLGFYLRFIGAHSWPVTGSLSLGICVFTFFFFEIGLNIILPKAYSEPLFLPLYDIFL